MKQLLLILTLVTAVLFPQAHGVVAQPSLRSLRTEILTQLDIATDGVATPDKKLVAALRKALVTIIYVDSGNYAAAAKTIGALAKVLNQPPLSTVFDPIFQNTVDTYITALTNAQSDLVASLGLAIPSKKQTDAQKALNMVLTALSNANSNNDVVLAAKYLEQAANLLNVSNKLTAAANRVQAPPASVTATVSGSSNFGYKSTLAGAIAFTTGGVINSAQAVLMAPFGQRTVAISLLGVNSGANTLAIGQGGGLCELLVTELYSNSTFNSYTSTTGTLNVAFNPTAKTLVGTFTATCVDGAKTITVNGSFSAKTL